MKVLDLECLDGHVFEGWFASEDDFLAQRERAVIECPFCGDASISKRPSAPRLNLGSAASGISQSPEVASVAGVGQALQTAWMTLARRIVEATDDVGEQFAEEARKIHYGEAKERGIRGQASMAETESLREEGIAVMQLSMPQALKGQLQ